MIGNTTHFGSEKTETGKQVGRTLDSPYREKAARDHSTAEARADETRLLAGIAAIPLAMIIGLICETIDLRPKEKVQTIAIGSHKRIDQAKRDGANELWVHRTNAQSNVHFHEVEQRLIRALCPPMNSQHNSLAHLGGILGLKSGSWRTRSRRRLPLGFSVV
ncbi:hypothetical protein [Bradyrhizobium sp. USDA 329]|uniref:hypothetical protein n=1 Tax=unclassified Bradyrhizobium TaxID=2631580 RepID=UPI0035124462